MPRKRPTNWSLAKHWRLRATAADGVAVTLGRYETEEEAHADSERFTERGGYHDLAIEPIEPVSDPPSPESAPPRPC
jgi:hypothetical protein